MNEKLCSMLVPTRWRPQFALQCIQSIVSATNDVSRLEIIVRVHDDDEDSLEYVQKYKDVHPCVKVLIGPDRGTWQRLAHFHEEMIAIAEGKWLWLLNDDVTFEKAKWDDSLSTVPLTGFVAYPQYDMLDTSRYETTAGGGPFPCIPNQSWGSQSFGQVFGGFNVDNSIKYFYFDKLQWKVHVIPGLMIHHHRYDAKDFIRKGPQGKIHDIKI